jgi:4'-phosphopantetheinyl transferase
MTFHDNDRVEKLFDASVRDLSPHKFADRILYMPVFPTQELTDTCASILSDIEVQRANSFLTNEARSLFIQRRAFRCYCGAIASDSRRQLSKIAFEETENGRPYLRERPDLWFSFSSSPSGFIGAWSTTHAIGVDIEDRTTDVETAELAQMFFTRSEARAVEATRSANPHTFIRLWCLKEAALKSIGEGLPFGLDAFEFELNGSVRIVDAPEEHGGPKHFSAELFERNEVFAALVARLPH